MSITIGIALSESSLAKEAVLIAAQKYQYRVVEGLQSIDQEVAVGFGNFLKVGFRFSNQTTWDQILFIATSDNPNAALAFGIYQEFQAWQNGGSRPDFLCFLEEVSDLLGNEQFKARFLFCTEFDCSDNVLIRRGTIEDLIKFLELPDFWTLSLWSPETGIVQESDRYPLVFCVGGS